jgi:hypothetical protein
MNGQIEPVTSDEKLARFVLFSKWFRSDSTVRHEAFMPHPHVDLSVTRHLGFTEPKIWGIGQEVATVRKVVLYGRADICAEDVMRQALGLQAAPVKNNSNHANITDWPTQKPEQKIIAMKLAATAKYHSKP